MNWTGELPYTEFDIQFLESLRITPWDPKAIMEAAQRDRESHLKWERDYRKRQQYAETAGTVIGLGLVLFFIVGAMYLFNGVLGWR